jgi:crotonobetainyl-CoA:carnitine CoA-transferase CaiB-like acyl-CoA transferase
VNAREVALDVLSGVGYDPRDLPEITIRERDPLLPSIFRVETMAGAFITATHAAYAVEMGVSNVSVDVREAAVAFRSEAYLRVDGNIAGDPWAPLSGDYRADDGRWIRLHCNFEHHARAVLRTLNAENDRPAVESAVARWNAIELEGAVLANGGAAAAERTVEEWDALAHAATLAHEPLVRIRRIGDAQPAQESLRVLDLTRVIAGPVAGRTLAAYAADVLFIGAKNVPQIPQLVIDTGFGKRFAEIDLHDEAQRDVMRTLVCESDVFLESYRPGALAGLGFGPHDAAAMRPGIIYASLSAYGADGPWGGRRGFDSLVQMATGITRETARRAGREQPAPLPAQALDHGTGWLAVLGILAARQRQRREGGSWHVEISLARTAEYLKSLGTVETSRLRLPIPKIDDVRDLLRDDESPFGRVTHVRFPGLVGGRELQWKSPPHPQGYDAATWVRSP